jgi:glycine dehydrogenase subunit 1
VPGDASEVIERLAERGILGGVPASRLDPGRSDLGGLIIVTATEVNTAGDIDAYAQTLTEILR